MNAHISCNPALNSTWKQQQCLNGIVIDAQHINFLFAFSTILYNAKGGLDDYYAKSIHDEKSEYSRIINAWWFHWESESTMALYTRYLLLIILKIYLRARLPWLELIIWIHWFKWPKKKLKCVNNVSILKTCQTPIPEIGQKCYMTPKTEKHDIHVDVFYFCHMSLIL